MGIVWSDADRITHLPSIQPSGITPWMAEPKKSCSAHAILVDLCFDSVRDKKEDG